MGDKKVRVSLWARDQRFLRAAQQVLAKYAIRRRVPGPDRLERFDVTGGQAPYVVTIDPDWGEDPTCTCPDAQQMGKELNAGYCKHVIGVLLSNDALRCQLLELFL